MTDKYGYELNIGDEVVWDNPAGYLVEGIVHDFIEDLSMVYVKDNNTKRLQVMGFHYLMKIL